MVVLATAGTAVQVRATRSVELTRELALWQAGFKRLVSRTPRVLMSYFRSAAFWVLDCGLPTPGPVAERSLLIVRLDAIGDYVLFRNFLGPLRRSRQFQDYRLTVLGNAAWKDLALALDGGTVDEWIWVEPKKMVLDFPYRRRTLVALRSRGFSVIIHPTFTREFYTGDWIVKAIPAREKIGRAGDSLFVQPWQKRVADRWYTRLIPASSGILFELYRNREFVEALLGRKVGPERPEIVLPSRRIPFAPPRPYAVLSIGAGETFRQWSMASFAAVATHLRSVYGLEIVVCSGKTDRGLADQLGTLIGFPFFDLVGRTDLVDLLYVLRNASLVVSNESAVPHLTLAVGRARVVVVCNGFFLGRFMPYPRQISSRYFPIFHPEIARDPEAYARISNTLGYRRRLPIGDISATEVISQIDAILPARRSPR